MIPSLFRSLRFQIAAALSALVLLFGATAVFTFFASQEQRSGNAVLYLAGKLQVTARHMASQAMNYKQHAPRDYPTYYRDLKLYYQDLMQDMETFQMISDAFMHEAFSPRLTGLPNEVEQRLDPESRAAVTRVETAWAEFHQELMTALGDDPENPRLEFAAEYIMESSGVLGQTATDLLETLHHQLTDSLEQINRANQIALALGLTIALGLLLWFYRRVLIPIDRTVNSIGRFAQGDFTHQLQRFGHQELDWLADGFNLLSGRMRALFRLIDRLQQGSNLDQTLAFVAEEFARLLPLDWVGILFVRGNRSSIQLDCSCSQGRLEPPLRTHFPVPADLLEQTLDTGRPLHLKDLAQRTVRHRHADLLGALAERGLQEAIFLPFAEPEQSPGLLLIATRQRGAYTPEHLALLANIAHLVTHSFERTLRLAERARLADIGELASGIAHEIRNPLATISMALDYFKRLELPGTGAKRAELASREAARMGRLLEDILLYAKAIQLDTRRLDLGQLLKEVLASHPSPAESRDQHFDLTGVEKGEFLLGDRDRLTQVILNLAQNACEAAPEGSDIGWRLIADRRAGTLALEVSNSGPPVPEDLLDRLTEPFFTTKPAGTGLGLAIVKRLVEAHGGDLQIESAPQRGTRVRLVFARAEQDTGFSGAQVQESTQAALKP